MIIQGGAQISLRRLEFNSMQLLETESANTNTNTNTNANTNAVDDVTDNINRNIKIKSKSSTYVDNAISDIDLITLQNKITKATAGFQLSLISDIERAKQIVKDNGYETSVSIMH
jgi:hypothetical protein